MALNCRIAALMLVALLCGMTSSIAQSAMPTEAVQSDGSIVPPLALTPAQRNAISTDVKRQRIHTSRTGIAAAVGAPAAPSLGLRDLPSMPALGGAATDLKYATVGGDVVVVDPTRMRVVEVIHSGSGP